MAKKMYDAHDEEDWEKPQSLREAIQMFWESVPKDGERIIFLGMKLMIIALIVIMIVHP